jgi:hypothetical protein
MDILRRNNMSVTNHICKEDGDMPEGLKYDDVFMIEVYTWLGWIDITADFTETQVGLQYNFYVE